MIGASGIDMGGGCTYGSAAVTATGDCHIALPLRLRDSELRLLPARRRAPESTVTHPPNSCVSC